ncbi:hypothetical protein [Streptomyces sp. G1]|uniref:hypothetical protein n=1 Tax=Streptomyces sp. G1 TaxID=361572 RepID=UPI0020306FEA|nr:hypothetical protein [Streptomyces sp. G1]MCM1974018.1 hypothetical protein [Streptomyces sp. G1]
MARSQAPSREGAALLSLMEHCAACHTCKPELDRMGRPVGTPARCPEADALHQALTAARKAAGR